MGYNYSRLARTAKRLIDKFGGPMTISGFVDSPNVAQPNRPGIRVPYEIKANAVFLDYKTEQVDGTKIQLGDQYCLASPQDVDIPPKLTGTIKRDGESAEWSIVGFETLNPGGMKLLYTIQVRK